MSKPEERLPKATTSSRWRRLSRRSVVGGLITALVVAAIGLALLGFRSVAWTVRSSLLILPTEVAAQTDGPGYYDTLNQGQIVATFAQVLQAENAPGQLPRSAGRTSDQASKVKIAMNAVPNTSIIDITVDAPTAGQAEQVANSVAAASLRTLEQLGTPYRASIVSPGKPALAKPIGPSRLTLGLVIAAVAILAGVGAQQVLWLVGAATASRSTSGTSTEPPRPYPAGQSPSHQNLPADAQDAVRPVARRLE
jgi:capsular polysaccharide biosynthesis protein